MINNLNAYLTGVSIIFQNMEGVSRFNLVFLIYSCVDHSDLFMHFVHIHTRINLQLNGEKGTQQIFIDKHG